MLPLPWISPSSPGKPDLPGARQYGASALAVTIALALLYLVHALVPGTIAPTEQMLPHLLERNPLSEPLVRWDAAWYNRIAQGGYFDQPSTAFWPLLPLLLRGLLMVGVPLSVADLLIPALATTLALPALHALLRTFLAREAAADALAILGAYPSFFFLLAPYPMSLFLLTAVWSFLLERRGHPWLAALCAALATLSWNLGILLVAVGAYRWWRHRRIADLAMALAPLAALGSYACYLALRFGQPFLFASVTSAVWHRQLSLPFRYLLEAASRLGSGTVPSPVTLWDMICVILMGAALLAGFALLPTDLALYSTLGFLVIASNGIPTSGDPLLSASRFTLALFPLFGVLGYSLERLRQRRWTRLMPGLFLAATGLLQVLFFLLYTQGILVG